MQTISPQSQSLNSSQIGQNAAQLAEVKHNDWYWRGHRIPYVSTGVNLSGYPPLLMIHGFGASTVHWKKNINELNHHFQVWAIDLLGFGRSEKPPVDYTTVLWRDQLHDFIDQKIGRPVILVGNSLGGYLSLCVAAEWPETVAGVILLNSAGSFTQLEPDVEAGLFVRQWRKLVGTIVRQPWAIYLIFINLRRPARVRQILQKVYHDQTAVTDELVEAILRPGFDRGAFEVFASVFRAGGQGPKVDELLQQMTCPLLTIWGEYDPWINAKERSIKFKQFYPQIVEHFLQAGHCPHDEVPTQVNRLIQDWVLGLGSDDRSGMR